MNINRVIFNRLLFRFLPILGILISICYFKEITLDNFLEKFGLLEWLLVTAFVYFSFDITKHLKKILERKINLQNQKLEDVPTNLDFPRKLNFLDKRLSINEQSIDVYLNTNLILNLSKNKKEIYLNRLFGHKKLKFNDIEFLFLEYNQYIKDTLKDQFFDYSYYDKNVWYNSIMAMQKNGQQVKLFEAKLEVTNYEQNEDSRISGKDEEKSYLENGQFIIRLFSHFTMKKYMILNNKV